MLENKKAVIFDLDGTLVDSMWIWREIDIRFLGKYGLKVPQGLNDKLEGYSFHETAVYFKELFSVAAYDRRDHGNMESYGFRNLYQ